MILRAVPESGCVSELLNLAIRGMGAAGCCLVAPLPLVAERVRPVGGAAQARGSAGVSVTRTACAARKPQKGGPRAVRPPCWTRCSGPGIQSSRDPALLRVDGAAGLGCAHSWHGDSGGWWRQLGLLLEGASPYSGRWVQSGWWIPGVTSGQGMGVD